MPRKTIITCDHCGAEQAPNTEYLWIRVALRLQSDESEWGIMLLMGETEQDEFSFEDEDARHFFTNFAWRDTCSPACALELARKHLAENRKESDA